jgi:hypothetical protein
MSLTWHVIPFNGHMPDLVDWLQQKDVVLPDAYRATVSRYPTLEELQAALTIFDGASIRIEEDMRLDVCEVVVGSYGSDLYVHMLGTITDDGCYDFHFWPRVFPEAAMIIVLKQLAPICGPLIVINDFSATPLLVTPETDVEAAFAEWCQRMPSLTFRP